MRVVAFLITMHSVYIVNSIFVTNITCPGENEIYKRCGFKDSSCQYPNPKCLDSYRICRKGCYCKPDFIRNDFDRCIHKSHCSNNIRCIGENEEFKECGFCDAKHSFRHLESCLPGCFCKSGYVRNAQNTCHRKKHILSCSENEKFTNCIECQATCTNPAPECNYDACNEGCKCKHGLIRGPHNRCIELKDCPCGKNQYMSECACDSTCKNSRNCINHSCEHGCTCVQGYVRNRSKKCIPKSRCKKPRFEIID